MSWQKGQDTPEEFEGPDGMKIVRSAEIGDGIYVEGWVFNPTLAGRVVIDFTVPRSSAESASGQPEDVWDVVARIWMTNEQFKVFIQTIQAMTKKPDNRSDT